MVKPDFNTTRLLDMSNSHVISPTFANHPIVDVDDSKSNSSSEYP